MNALKQEGDVDALRNYMQENRGYLAIAPAVNSLHNQVNKIREAKKAIINSNKSPEEKRTILDNLTANETKLLGNVRDIHRKALEVQD